MLINVNINGDFEEKKEEEYLNQIFEQGGESINVNVKYNKQSSQLITKIKDWKEHSKLKQASNDHTRCLKCKDQLYFCDGVTVLADEILVQMEKENLI